MQGLKWLIRDERGQGMSEYALLLMMFVVAMAVLTQITDLKNTIANVFTDTATTIESPGGS